jgi:hypothetical protein
MTIRRFDNFHWIEVISTMWKSVYQIVESCLCPLGFEKMIRSDINPPIKPSRNFSKTVGIVLVIITILSLTVAGISSLNHHVTTLTQQQLVTNTQSFYSTQTLTRVSTQTVSSITSVGTSGLPASYYQYCNMYNCSPYAAPPGSTNFGCYSTGPYSITGNSTNVATVQCYGYLYTDASGCLDLVVPIDNGYSNQIQQYYFLQNLPSSHPANGTWVKVTGQLNIQGNNQGPNGGTCPSSSISVTSIT